MANNSANNSINNQNNCLKVVLITGVSSGIGEATALKFASLKNTNNLYNVVVTGSDEMKVKNVAAKCRRVVSHAQRVIEIVGNCDTDSMAAEEVMRTVISEFGRLDTLITHDGAVIYHSMADDKLMDIFDEVINSNLRSVLRLIQLAVPHLEKTKGSIVNVSSLAAIKPVPSMMTYCAAKAALDQMTRCLAIELAQKGIRINSVNPALTRTPLMNYGGLTEGNPTEIARNSLNRQRQFHEMEDIANAIIFLSSDKASFITGTILPIDGTNLQN